LATVDKDFKVKNGLVVTNGGSFGGSVVVGTPTLANHAVTKEYVDALTGGIPVGTTPPSSPTNGQLWLDELTSRVNVYYGGVWLTVATMDDVQNIPQHIHDTAIDGTGLIVTTFYNGGSFNDPQSTGFDGGSPSTNTWDVLADGGSPVDNFN